MKKLSNENKKFDLIFIDAGKQSYPEYFNEAINLSHCGTVKIFDNALRGVRIIENAGEDKELKSPQITNDLMATGTRIESSLVPIGDGFCIGRVI